MEQLLLDIRGFFTGALGFLAAAFSIAYWTYALRLIIDMKINDLGIKISAILANFFLPVIFPLIVYVYYFGWYRRRYSKQNAVNSLS
jgi:hypothetical protein